MSTTTESFNHGAPWEEESYGLNQALRVGDTIYVSGQVPYDEQGLVGEGDVVEQCAAAFASLDVVLDHFGATRDQVIETTVVLTDLRDNFPAVATAHRAYFEGHRPTSTAIGAADLALPGQLVEIGALVRLDLPR